MLDRLLSEYEYQIVQIEKLLDSRERVRGRIVVNPCTADVCSQRTICRIVRADLVVNFYPLPGLGEGGDGTSQG